MNDQLAPPAGQVPLPAASTDDADHPLLAAVAQRYATLAALVAQATAAGKAGAGLNDPDVVHDLRVGSRRVGEVARLLASFVDKPAAKAVAASLRDLRRAMGDLRDADVTREHLTHWRMPAPVRAVARELAAELEARRPGLVEAAAAVISSPGVQQAMAALSRTLEEQSRPAAADAAEKRLETLVAQGLQKRAKQVRRAFGKAAREQSPDTLHAARVSVKKLRYVTELAAEARNKNDASDLKRQVKALKKIQELLGDHHDVHVIVQTLKDRLDAPRPKPLRRLQPAWQSWRKSTDRAQARRASDFFVRTYEWMNRS